MLDAVAYMEKALWYATRDGKRESEPVPEE